MFNNVIGLVIKANIFFSQSANKLEKNSCYRGLYKAYSIKFTTMSRCCLAGKYVPQYICKAFLDQ